MKRFIALFIITVFISVQGVYAQDTNTNTKTENSNELNNEEIYKIYSDSLDKLFNLKSFQNNNKYTCIRNGEKPDIIKLDSTIKQINKGIADFDVYVNAVLSCISDSLNHTESNEMYYKNGYSYMDLSGEKLKQEISFCDMISTLESKNLYLGIVKDEIKNASIKSTDDGGKEINFDIYYGKISYSENDSEVMRYRIKALSAFLGVRNFEDDNQNDFKYIVKINKDGVIVSGSLSCDLKVDKDELINFKYDFNISDINNTNINFPNFNSYKSPEEYMKEYLEESEEYLEKQKKYYDEYEEYSEYNGEEDYYDFFEYDNYDIKIL